jgi:hypothetical protein
MDIVLYSYVGQLSAAPISKNCDLSVLQNNFLKLHFITPVSDVLGRPMCHHGCPTIFKLSTIFGYASLCYTVTIHISHLAVNFVGEDIFWPYNWSYYKIICGAEFLMFLHLHIKLSPEKHVPDYCIIYCMFTMLQGLPKLWGTETYLFNAPFISQKQTKKMIQCDYRKNSKYKGKSECNVSHFIPTKQMIIAMSAHDPTTRLHVLHQYRKRVLGV